MTLLYHIISYIRIIIYIRQEWSIINFSPEKKCALGIKSLGNTGLGGWCSWDRGWWSVQSENLYLWLKGVEKCIFQPLEKGRWNCSVEHASAVMIQMLDRYNPIMIQISQISLILTYNGERLKLEHFLPYASITTESWKHNSQHNCLLTAKVTDIKLLHLSIPKTPSPGVQKTVYV